MWYHRLSAGRAKLPGWILPALLPGAALAEIPVMEAPRADDAAFMRSAGYWDAGPVRIYPSLEMALGYDSNLFESSTHERDSNFLNIVPELSVLWRGAASQILGGYQATQISFADSSADDFTDQRVFGRAHLEGGYRHRFDINADYALAHEPRGSGLTVGIDPDSPLLPTDPDEYTEQNLQLRYEFGAREARGMLRFEAGGYDRNYQNNLERTDYFDRMETQAGGTFLWRVFPRSALAFEVRAKDVNYPNDRPGESSLDSSEQSYLIGAEWEITEFTSGRLRVGEQTKDFTADDRDDSRSPVWSLSGNWAPRSYSTFNLLLERRAVETSGDGDFVDTQNYALGWTHQWRERLRTQLEYKWIDETFENGTRTQDTHEIKLDAGYAMFHWLTLHFVAVQRDRDSDRPNYAFGRDRYWLTWEFKL